MNVDAGVRHDDVASPATADAVRRLDCAVDLPDGATATLCVYSVPGPMVATAIFLPAMGVEVGYYEPFCRGLARAGVRTVAVELRGQGTSSVRASRHVNYTIGDIVAMDLTAVVDAVRGRWRGRPLVLVGHSFGGLLAVYRAARAAHDIDAVVLVASGSPHYRNWPRVTGVALAVALRIGMLLTRGLGYFPGRVVGFGGTQARGLMLEWFGLAISGRHRIPSLGGDLTPDLASLRHPVLAISLAGDDYAPAGSARALLESLSSAEIAHWQLSSSDLGMGTVNHFNWARSAAISKHVAGWIDGKLAARWG